MDISGCLPPFSPKLVVATRGQGGSHGHQRDGRLKVRDLAGEFSGMMLPKLGDDVDTLEVNHHFKNGGSFWKMINPYKIMVVWKPTYKKLWLDFQGRYWYIFLFKTNGLSNMARSLQGSKCSKKPWWTHPFLSNCWMSNMEDWNTYPFKQHGWREIFFYQENACPDRVPTWWFFHWVCMTYTPSQKKQFETIKRGWAPKGSRIVGPNFQPSIWQGSMLVSGGKW